MIANMVGGGSLVIFKTTDMLKIGLLILKNEYGIKKTLLSSMFINQIFSNRSLLPAPSGLRGSLYGNKPVELLF